MLINSRNPIGWDRKTFLWIFSSFLLAIHCQLLLKPFPFSQSHARVKSYVFVIQLGFAFRSLRERKFYRNCYPFVYRLLFLSSFFSILTRVNIFRIICDKFTPFYIFKISLISSLMLPTAQSCGHPQRVVVK